MSVVNGPDSFVYNLLAYQVPPVISFPLEQSFTLICVYIVLTAGLFPMAVTTKLNSRTASVSVTIYTFSSLYILAPTPMIE